VWTEPMSGAEARSVRRWVRRTLPDRADRALLIMLLAFVFILALGRLVGDRELPRGCLSECEQPQRDLDIWDAIF
jgi:hypothetical protein